MIRTALTALFLSLLPISELRGAIPYAYFNGIGIIQSYLIGVLGNMIVIPAGFLFFSIVEKILLKFEFFRNFIEKRALKVRDNFTKYGYLGLTVFVAIPLPVTGAWTGILGAWFLGLDKKKSSLAVAAGVLIAGLIVSIVILTGSGLASVFTKTISV